MQVLSGGGGVESKEQQFRMYKIKNIDYLQQLSNDYSLENITTLSYNRLQKQLKS